MIEVEVRDRDRVDARPAVVESAQAREHAGPAVEQQAPLALDEIAGLGAARVGPGGGAADHRELHTPILADFSGSAFGV